MMTQSEVNTRRALAGRLPVHTLSTSERITVALAVERPDLLPNPYRFAEDGGWSRLEEWQRAIVEDVKAGRIPVLPYC